MKTNTRKYEMLVNQFRSNFFRIRLVEHKKMRCNVVFETFADTIPATVDILEQYQRVRPILQHY